MDDWREVLARSSGSSPGVVAAAPEVITQAGITAGHDYAEGVNVLGFDPDTGAHAVTTLPQAIAQGDLSLPARPSPTSMAGIVLGSRLAERLSVYPGDVVTLVAGRPGQGEPGARAWRCRGSGSSR